LAPAVELAPAALVPAALVPAAAVPAALVPAADGGEPLLPAAVFPSVEPPSSPQAEKVNAQMQIAVRIREEDDELT
jgi:hypothetical protein